MRTQEPAIFSQSLSKLTLLKKYQARIKKKKRTRKTDRQKTISHRTPSRALYIDYFCGVEEGKSTEDISNAGEVKRVARRGRNVNGDDQEG